MDMENDDTSKFQRLTSPGLTGDPVPGMTLFAIPQGTVDTTARSLAGMAMGCSIMTLLITALALAVGR